jgi:hypothetical protein
MHPLVAEFAVVRFFVGKLSSLLHPGTLAAHAWKHLYFRGELAQQRVFEAALAPMHVPCLFVRVAIPLLFLVASRGADALA